MRELAVFILVSFGLTTLITRSVLVRVMTKAIRLNALPVLSTGLRCAQCVGFWVGIGLSVSGFIQMDVSGRHWLDIIFAGFISSGASWFLATIANPYQEVQNDN